MALNFECLHDHTAGTMTCSWLLGRVQLVEYFRLAKTYVLIDDVVKCCCDNLTIDEFVRLQCACQRAVAELL